MAEPVVLYELDDKVSIITLNRPEKLNAISPELMQQLLAAFARAAAVSDKPHYLLHTRAGHIDPAHVACLRDAGIPIVTGIREGLGAIDRLARWGAEKADWKRNSV